MSIRDFSDQNPGPVMQINANGVITHANPAASDIFKLKASDELELSAMLPDIDLEQLSEIRKSGGSFQKEITTNKRCYLLQFIGLPEYAAVNIYGLDITEQKTLTAGIGHEIKNPLAIIRGNIELLKDIPDIQSDLVEKRLNSALKSTERIAKILDGLRHFTQSDYNNNESLNADIIKSDLSTQSILLIEDEPELIDILKFYLKDFNANLKVIQNSEEAKDIIRSNKFDLIMSDLKMPHVSGLELLKLSRTLYGKSQKFIITTGGDPAEISGLPDELAPDQIIYKPYSKPSLINAVESLLYASGDKVKVAA